MKAKYLFACQIARFAADAGMTVPQACELHKLACRAFSAGVRECNTGKSADKARAKVVEFAESLGLKTSWPGLLATFTRRDGEPLYMPGM